VNVEEILAVCCDRRIKLWRDGEQLRYRAPPGALDEQLTAQIRTQRAAILQRLGDGLCQPDPANLHERFPLTPVQAAYVLGRNTAFAFGGNACHLYADYSWSAGINTERLESAWNDCVRAHPMLRAIIEDAAWQRVLHDTPWQHLTVHDLRDAKSTTVDSHLHQVRDRLDHAVHDLTQWPILRPEVTLTATQTILHLSVDFALIDYASLQMLLHEWQRRYDDPAWKPEPLTVSFRDYVMYEQHARTSEDYAKDRSWWVARLEQLPGRPELPIHHDGEQAGIKFSHRHGRLDERTWTSLCTHASVYGLSSAGVVLAAFAEVIGRWSQSTAFCLNLTVLNRPPVHRQIDAVLGDFTTLSLLAVDSIQGDTFVERARRIGEQIFDDLEHRRYSGVELLRELARQQGRGADLMPVVFTSGIGNMQRLLQSTSHTLQPPLYMVSQTPQVWLDCQVTDQFGGLEFGWDVREGVFLPGVVDEMFQAYDRLLRQLADSASNWQTTDDLLLPKPSESVQTHPTAGTNIAAGFTAQALRTPQASVVIDVHGTYSYQQIAQMAAAVCSALQALNIKAGDRIAVLIPKCAEQLMAVLGIIQSGAVYVPVDVRQPETRQRTILDRANVAAVVSLSGVAVTVSEPRVNVDTLQADPLWPPRPGHPANGSDPAYIIYTSGSTGTPKGVQLSHAAVCNTLVDINERYAVGPDDCMLGLAELSFDLSVYDLFGVTAQGALLVLPDPARSGDPSHWAELMMQHKITLWNSVPAQSAMLMDYLESEPALDIPGPRCVLWSGDWIPISLPTRWWHRWPQSQLYSLGGATEAAIWSIEHPIRPEDTELPSIPYGRALRGQTVEVLDFLGRRCPSRVQGEIYIGGIGLALGYADDPEQTAQRFIMHRDGRRLYRTGDLGRYRSDGIIEFLGRQDNQVKIRGHRIELAEVDAALFAQPEVATVATIVLGERSERRLVSFATLHPVSVNTDEVQAQMWEAAQSIRSVFEAQTWPVKSELDRSLTQLRQACSASLAQWLSASGIFECDMAMDFATLCERLHVPPAYHRLLRHWLRMLTEDRYLLYSEAGWRVTSETPTRDAQACWEAFVKDADVRLWPTALTDYLRNSAAQLAAQVTGETSPTLLMFPESSTHIAEAMYSQGLHAQALHDGMARAAAHIVERQPQRTWRILEIGAGTGAASTKVIEALAPLVQAGTRIEYLFTDVSGFFLAVARERYSAYPWVRCLPFDMNGDPLQQNIPPHSLDMVLSSGALNNARNTRKVIANLRELSTSDAWWLIQELVCEHPEISISQGLMMESPEDERIGTDDLFIHTTQWLQWLTAHPRDQAIAVTSSGSPLRQLGYDILLVRVKIDARRLAPQALLAALAERLPRYMLPSQLRVLDHMPVTPNGKIDRRRLADLAQTADDVLMPPHISAQEATHDELTTRLIGHWEAVLNGQKLGADQDFFAAGGDSLQLTKLIARLREHEAIAQAHPFDRLLRQALSVPTPAGMANFLRIHAEPSSVDVRHTTPMRKISSGMVIHAPTGARRNITTPIHLTKGNGTPRVIVHEGLGTLHAYRAAIPALSSISPLFGYTVHDSDDYLAISPTHLNVTLGRRYAQALWRKGLREVRVLGYCSGGLVALELAKALLQFGGNVQALDIVSSYRIPYLIEDDLLLLYNYAATLGLPCEELGFPSVDVLAHALGRVLEVQPEHVAPGAITKQLQEMNHICPPSDVLRRRVFNTACGQQDTIAAEQANLLLQEQERRYHVFAHSVQASHWSGRAAYTGSIRLCVPQQCNPLISEPESALSAYWQSQALDGFTMVSIAGTHFNCLTENFVTEHLAGEAL